MLHSRLRDGGPFGWQMSIRETLLHATLLLGGLCSSGFTARRSVCPKHSMGGEKGEKRVQLCSHTRKRGILG